MPASHNFINLREIVGDVLCLATPNKQKREYRAVIQVPSLTFALMSETEQESIIEAFRSFLTRIPDIVIHAKISPYNLTPYLQQIQKSPMVSLAESHCNFVLSLAAERALLQRDFYIVVGADTHEKMNLAQAFDIARTQLDQHCTDIISDLERCGLKAWRMSDTELTNYYLSGVHASSAEDDPISDALAVDTLVQASISSHDSYENDENVSPGKKEHESYDPLVSMLLSSSSVSLRLLGQAFRVTKRVQQARTHLSVRKTRHKKEKQFDASEYPDLIRVTELVQPSSVELRRTYLRVNAREDEYIRTFAVIGYPRQVYPGWLDRLLNLDMPFVEVALHIHPLDSAIHINKLSRKLVSFRGSEIVSTEKGKQLNPYIAAAMQDVREMRDKLIKQEEQVFGVSLYFLIRASTKALLEEKSNKLYSQFKSLDLRAVPLTMRHAQGWQCFLPGPDRLKMRRLLDTSSVATAFPFTDTAVSTPGGTLRGVANNGSLILIDEFSDILENGNECVFAKSGSGKSYDSKVRIMRNLISGIHECVIAPENEYDRLARYVNGQIIVLNSVSLHMNPFDVYLGEEAEETMREKNESLLTLLDLLLAEAEKKVLPQNEKAYLQKAIAYLYDEVCTKTPSMRSLHEIILSGVCGTDTYSLAERLARYVPLFPDAPTPIDFDNPLIVFNIRDLSESLRGVGLFLIAEFVWSQVKRKHLSTPHQLLLDEAWTLLQHEGGGRFLASIARRARKYRLALKIVTHDVRDCLENAWGRAILTNASLTFLMRQDHTAIDAVTQAFNLSVNERRFLLSAGQGEGLLSIKGKRVSMRVIASDLEHRIATTNPKEVQQIEQLEEEEGIMKKAVVATH